jgi:hypothetical protein
MWFIRVADGGVKWVGKREGAVLGQGQECPGHERGGIGYEYSGRVWVGTR